jgi:hypothetical protein
MSPLGPPALGGAAGRAAAAAGRRAGPDGSIGLLRLRSFYERVHAPTLGTTLGIGCILLASMLFFSVVQTAVRCCTRS